MERKEQEIIMSTECENLKDCIFNMTYKFDKYVSCINTYVPMIYKNDSIDDKYLELLKFIFSEHENIIIQKGIKFMIEGVQLITRKYSSFNKILRDFQEDDENIRYQIKLSSDSSEYINLINSNFEVYSITEKYFDPALYLFTEYTKDRINNYREIVSNFDNHEFTTKELQARFNEYMLYTLKIAKHTKKMSEQSSSPILTAKLTREMINLLVLMLSMTQTLKIVK